MELPDSDIGVQQIDSRVAFVIQHLLGQKEGEERKEEGGKEQNEWETERGEGRKQVNEYFWCVYIYTSDHMHAYTLSIASNQVFSTFNIIYSTHQYTGVVKEYNYN